VLSPYEWTALVSGKGAGKTFALAVAAVDQLIKCSKHKHNVLLLVEPTYPMLHDILEPVLFDYLDMCDIKYNFNQNKYEITTKYGILRMRSGENYTRLAGAQYSAVFIDEFDKMKSKKAQQGLIDHIVARTRLAGTSAKKFITTTPETGMFTHEFFVENPSDHKKIIFASTNDNPFNRDGYVQSLMNIYDERKQQAYIHGKFTNLTEGRAYYMFNQDRHVVKRTSEPFIRLNIAFDFNVNPMTATLSMQKDGKDIIIDEYWVKNSNTQQACDWIIKNYLIHHSNYYEVHIYGDATGKSRSTSSQYTNYQIIDRALKTYAASITYHIRKKNPSVIDRVNVVNNCLDKGVVSIYDNCKHLIGDLNKVQLTDDGRSIDKGRDSDLTHISDALGYMLYEKYNQAQSFGAKTSVIAGGKKINNRR
jgi:hypothetical protein